MKMDDSINVSLQVNMTIDMDTQRDFDLPLTEEDMQRIKNGEDIRADIEERIRDDYNEDSYNIEEFESDHGVENLKDLDPDFRIDSIEFDLPELETVISGMIKIKTTSPKTAKKWLEDKLLELAKLSDFKELIFTVNTESEEEQDG